MAIVQHRDGIHVSAAQHHPHRYCAVGERSHPAMRFAHVRQVPGIQGTSTCYPITRASVSPVLTNTFATVGAIPPGSVGNREMPEPMGCMPPRAHGLPADPLGAYRRRSTPPLRQRGSESTRASGGLTVCPKPRQVELPVFSHPWLHPSCTAMPSMRSLSARGQTLAGVVCASFGAP